MRVHSFLKRIPLSPRSLLVIIGISLLLWTPATGAIIIAKDPQGFFGSLWGSSLEDRPDLKQIDSMDSVQVYTVLMPPPQIEGIPLDSAKLYTLEDNYARALFHYHGEATHKSLLEYLEAQFGKIDTFYYGSMIRGLSQHYTWRGPETEITLTYHGFRERGFLAAESRVHAPGIMEKFGNF